MNTTTDNDKATIDLAKPFNCLFDFKIRIKDTILEKKMIMDSMIVSLFIDFIMLACSWVIAVTIAITSTKRITSKEYKHMLASLDFLIKYLQI